jgi:hypothetical protein
MSLFFINNYQNGLDKLLVNFDEILGLIVDLGTLTHYCSLATYSFACLYP